MSEFTKKERKELRREERVLEKQRSEKQKFIKRVAKITLFIAAAVGIVGAAGWYIASRPPIPEGEIITRTGLHWHPELSIFVNGKKQEIPENIGIGAVENPIHTHDSSGTIHLEFSGIVKKDDIKLGRFFEVWGKDFNGFGKLAKMTVNGKENPELQNYIMRDGDKIELYYEK